MFDFYFGLLSTVFGPLISVPAAGIFVLSALVSVVITLFYRFLVDQNLMREIREELRHIQKQMKEAQKNDINKANELSGKMFKLTNKQMMLNMKPMIASMILVFPLLPWIASVFTGPVVLLPFRLPFFGNDFGWLMWYIVASMPITMFSRKVFDIV